MSSISIALAMLLAVAASGYLVRIVPVSVPLPFMQIALGAIISGVFDRGQELDPDLFFLLFLPPLLFLDGWTIPKKGLFRDRMAILELAFGLVIFSVVGVGCLIYGLIPHLSLAAAFALAAIITPTDPVALNSVAAKVPIPKRILYILQGESLFNDATGVVCFQFAVSAALTGRFSLAHASLTFLWVALAGALIGAVTVFTISLVQSWIWRKFGEEPGASILVNLLCPFAAYILAEHLQASGILAAVTAGVVMSYVELSGAAPGILRVQRWAVWDTVKFAFNGIIFVLLGEQLPEIVEGAMRFVRESDHLNPWWLVLYVLVISAGLAALRFIWVFVSLRWTLFRTARRDQLFAPLSWRIVMIMSLAGVRGAVTLAGVLTLPIAMPNGMLFPARQLIIFLATLVILVSLVVARLALPPLLRGLVMPEDHSHGEDEEVALRYSAKAALEAIEKLRQQVSHEGENSECYNLAATQVSQLYQRRLGIDTLENDPEKAQITEAAIRRFRQAGLAAERDEIFKMARQGRISDSVSRRLVHSLDLNEVRHTE